MTGDVIGAEEKHDGPRNDLSEKKIDDLDGTTFPGSSGASYI